MARVELMPGIASISGSVGNITFRTINGKTHVFERRTAKLREDATRAEKEKYKRDRIIRQCVSIIQDETGDWQKAIRIRTTIRNRIVYLYNKYVKEIKAPTKLQAKIMGEYRSKWAKSGDSLDKGSM